jgi:hypothetical protein
MRELLFVIIILGGFILLGISIQLIYIGIQNVVEHMNKNKKGKMK